jgi:hypothetical protein
MLDLSMQLILNKINKGEETHSKQNAYDFQFEEIENLSFQNQEDGYF